MVLETGSSDATTPSTRQIPGTATGSKGQGYQGADLADANRIPVVEKSAQVQKILEQQLKASTIGENSLAEAVKTAMTVQDEARAKTALYNKELADLQTQHKLLNNAIATESSMLNADVKNTR